MGQVLGVAQTAVKPACKALGLPCSSFRGPFQDALFCAANSLPALSKTPYLCSQSPHSLRAVLLCASTAWDLPAQPAGHRPAFHQQWLHPREPDQS